MFAIYHQRIFASEIDLYDIFAGVPLLMSAGALKVLSFIRVWDIYSSKKSKLYQSPTNRNLKQRDGVTLKGNLLNLPYKPAEE